MPLPLPRRRLALHVAKALDPQVSNQPCSEMKRSARVLSLVLCFSTSLIWGQASSSCCPQAPTKEKQQALWQKLQDRIAEVDRHLDGVMGVAIRDLTSGETYLLHADDVFAQASSIKITVLAQ